MLLLYFDFQELIFILWIFLFYTILSLFHNRNIFSYLSWEYKVVFLSLLCPNSLFPTVSFLYFSHVWRPRCFFLLKNWGQKADCLWEPASLSLSSFPSQIPLRRFFPFPVWRWRSGCQLSRNHMERESSGVSHLFPMPSFDLLFPGWHHWPSHFLEIPRTGTLALLLSDVFMEKGSFIQLERRRRRFCGFLEWFSNQSCSFSFCPLPLLLEVPSADNSWAFWECVTKHEFLAFPAAGLEFSFFRSAKSFNTEYIWCPASEVVWLLSPSSFSSCLFFILFIFLFMCFAF